MILIHRVSQWSGKPTSMMIDLTEEEFNAANAQWVDNGGTLMVHEAFAMLPAAQREFLLTGTTAEEQAHIWGTYGTADVQNT
jgi:hypothetical protein